MSVRTGQRGQLAAGIALLGFGLFMVWQASLLKVGFPTNPGPGFFPMWLGVALALLAAVLIGQAFAADGVAAAAPAGSTSSYRGIAAVLGLLLIAALMLEPLGYLISMGLLTAALLRLAGRGWKATLAIAVIATVGGYLLFDLALGTPLPSGVLDGLL